MCGIFGISGHEEAARLAYFGLYALQHRGQESAGIATWADGEIHSHVGMGLVPMYLPRKFSCICRETYPWGMCAIPPPEGPNRAMPSR